MLDQKTAARARKHMLENQRKVGILLDANGDPIRTPEGNNQFDPERMHLVFEQIGAPTSFSKARLSDLQPVIAGEAEAWINSLPTATTGKGLVIVGPRQVGKTYAAAAMVHRAASMISVGWRDYRWVSRCVFNSVSDDPDEDMALDLDRHLRDGYGLLVVDNVSVVSNSEFVTSTFEELLHHRMDYGLHTILTAGPYSVGKAGKDAERSLVSYINAAYSTLTL